MQRRLCIVLQISPCCLQSPLVPLWQIFCFLTAVETKKRMPEEGGSGTAWRAQLAESSDSHLKRVGLLFRETKQQSGGISLGLK